MRYAILAIVFALTAYAAFPAAAVTVIRVFGPAMPTGHYKRPALITELRNGSLYLAWYGGDGEYEPATAVYGARLVKAGGKRSELVVLARDPGNPVLWPVLFEQTAVAAH